MLPQEHFGKTRLLGHWYIGPIVKIHGERRFSNLLKMHHLFWLIHHTLQREFLKPSQLLFLKMCMETFCLAKRGPWYRVRIVRGKVKSRRKLRFFHSWELSCLLNFYFSYINWGKRWVKLAVVQGLCNGNLYQGLNDAYKSCVIFSSCFALDLSHPGCSMQAASRAIRQVTCEGLIFFLVLLKSLVICARSEVQLTSSMWQAVENLCVAEVCRCPFAMAAIRRALVLIYKQLYLLLSSLKITTPKCLSSCDTGHNGFAWHVSLLLSLKISLGRGLEF